jgi:hypothetical protein
MPASMSASNAQQTKAAAGAGGAAGWGGGEEAAGVLSWNVAQKLYLHQPHRVEIDVTIHHNHPAGHKTIFMRCVIGKVR